VGQIVRDKWKLERLLGVGGMAAVYEASHRNGKRVAVKWLHSELTIDDAVRARFLREGYIANKVGHAGAVSVLDDETADDGALLLVMELLHGETIDARRARLERLPPGDVLVVAHQVLDVLVAAHAQGIVHRDLKPENLFLTRDGAIKVLDFGIARLRELHATTQGTISRASLGTPGFMPPEQARGRSEEVDARTDLWALGATMFQLLTARHVHEAGTVNEQLLAAMTAPAPAVQSVRPDVPAPVARVVDRALAFDRSERWADAREMQLAVREAYRQLIGTPVAQAPAMVPVESNDPEVEVSGPLSETLPAAPGDARTTGRSVVSASRQMTTGASARRSRAWWGLGLAALGIAAAVPVAFLASRPARVSEPVAASSPALAPAPPAPSTALAASIAAATPPTPPPSEAPAATPVSAARAGAPRVTRPVATGSVATTQPSTEPASVTAPPPAPPASAAPSVDPLDRRR
jgi:serine/threonine-protein kinase